MGKGAIAFFGSVLVSMSVVKATETCNEGDLMTNSSSWSGNQLYNLTFDMDPLYASSTCCSIAAGFASLRSENITDGLPFQLSIVGPPDDPGHVGQFSYLCVTYDYGATLDLTADENSTTGVTPELAPFPPPPPPCDGFSDRDECMGQPGNQCWWGEESGCDESPPIACGPNLADDPPPPLCFHIGTNTSQDLGPWQLLGVDNTHATVYDAPPDTFSTDCYFSISNGQESLPEPHLMPFQYCAEYLSTVDEKAILEVCVKLTGVYDASWAVGEDSGIALSAGFVSSDAYFMIDYIVDDDESKTAHPTKGSMTVVANLRHGFGPAF